jgi:hypothetical protein
MSDTPFRTLAIAVAFAAGTIAIPGAHHSFPAYYFEAGTVRGQSGDCPGTVPGLSPD